MAQKTLQMAGFTTPQANELAPKLTIVDPTSESQDSEPNLPLRQSL